MKWFDENGHFVLFILIALAGYIVAATTPAYAILSDYSYYKEITITGNNANNTIISIDTQALNASGKLLGNCFDMNFTNSTDSAINFWIENCSMTLGTNSTIAINTTGLGSSFTLRMYYGNSSKLSTSSNISKVFGFNSDDFSEASFNTTRWTNKAGAGNFTNQNGFLNISSVAANDENIYFMKMANLPSTNYTLVWKQKIYAPYSKYGQGGIMFNNQTLGYDTSSNEIMWVEENHSTWSKNELGQVSGKTGGSNFDRVITTAAQSDISWHTYYIRRDGSKFNFSIDSTNYGNYTHNNIDSLPYVEMRYYYDQGAYVETDLDYVYVKDNNNASFSVGSELSTSYPIINYPVNLTYYSFPNYFQFSTTMPNLSCYHIRNIAQNNLTSGLVGYWDADGGGSNQTNITDSSGLGNDGSYIGDVFSNGNCFNGAASANCSFTPSGKYGQGFSANGSTYFNTSASGYVNVTGYQMTIMYDLKVNSFLGGYDVVALKGLSYGNDIYQDGSIVGLINGGIYATSPAGSVTAGTWNHIAITFNGSNMTFYRNGTFLSSTAGALTNISSTTYGLYVGAYYGGDFGNFSIDNIKIYNRTLNATEILQEANSSVPVNGYKLVGDWEFEDVTGNITKDTHNFQAGKVGTGLKFDSGQTVSLSNTVGNFSNASNFTIMGWFKPEISQAAAVYAIGKYPGGRPLYDIYFRLGYIRTEIYNVASTGCGAVNDAPFTSYSWVHIAMQFNSVTKNMTKYINGVKIADYDCSAVTSFVNTGNFVIGGLTSPGAFNGSIDEVRIYNRSLSGAEISEYYNATSSIYNVTANVSTTKNINYINTTANSIQLNCLNILTPSSKTNTTTFYSVMGTEIIALNKSNSGSIENYTVTIYNATNSVTINSWTDGDGNDSLATLNPEQHIGGSTTIFISALGYSNYINTTIFTEIFPRNYTAYIQRAGVDLNVYDEATGNHTVAVNTTIMIYNSTTSMNFTGNNFSWYYSELPGDSITIVAQYQNITMRKIIKNNSTTYNNITLTFQNNVILFSFYVYDSYNVPVNGSLISIYSNGELISQGYTQNDGYLTDVYLVNQLPVYIYLSKNGMYNTSTYFIPSPNIVQPFRLRMDYQGITPLPNQSLEVRCTYNPVDLLVGYNTSIIMNITDPMSLLTTSNLSIYKVNYSGSYILYTQSCSNASSCVFSYNLSNATSKYAILLNSSRNGSTFICTREYVTNSSSSSLFSNQDLSGSTGLSKQELKFVWFLAMIFITGLCYRFLGPGSLILIPLIVGYGWVCGVYTLGELILISILTLVVFFGVM